MKKTFLAIAWAVGVAGAFSAQADNVSIVSPGSTWEYTFTDPGASAWNTGATPSGWLSGPAPFGNNTGGYWTDPAGNFDYATYWPADTNSDNDLWVRTTFDLYQTEWDLNSITWGLGVDNGYTLYLNGTLISSASAGGYTSQWEYTGSFTTPTLVQGVNVLAIALQDMGGLTAFDMEVRGNFDTSGGATPNPSGIVPLPGAAAMGFLGMGCLGLVRRRKQTA
ncbi:MAG: hypothetical protein JNK74_08585 [Candidatus Hydrogenedentes bacterium]|nr:hypothetical protein [Candidatus Hydrogenedentota bacterium]